jgi:high-affinity iron transporter
VLSNALIGLREGLEASLVVSILIAFLVQTDRRRELPRVWLGAGVAVAVSIGVVLVLTLTEQALTFQAQEIFGGVLSIVSVGFVTRMIFWMRGAARSIGHELRGGLEKALAMGPVAVVVMSALAVGREGLETSVFFFSAVQAAGSTVGPLVGFLIGIAVSVLLAFLLYRGALRLNMGKFFTITGILLVFVAAGILAYGVHDLQEAGVLPGLRTLAFDLTGPVPETSWYGALLKGTFNYSAQTTVLQAVVWVLYVAIVLTVFLLPDRRRASAPAAAAASAG